MVKATFTAEQSRQFDIGLQAKKDTFPSVDGLFRKGEWASYARIPAEAQW